MVFVIRAKGETMCEFCENLTDEPRQYQKDTYGEIYLVRYGRKTLLLVEQDKCPPYAECSAKNVPIRSGYEINYCPECGADLRERREDDSQK